MITKKHLFFITVSGIFFLNPSIANADVGSCTQKIVKSPELNSGPFSWDSGTLVHSETHQGMNYHLIFLNAGGREAELVIKENASTCENLLYNPTASLVEYKTIMPAPVAKVMEVKLREYSKQISQRRQNQY